MDANTPIEDRYFDVLHNIESAIVSVYRVNPDLSDYEVDKALAVLCDSYRAGEQVKPYLLPAMNKNTDAVYAVTQRICDWRLGRDVKFETESGKSLPEVPPISVDEILVCLKRIRKSVAKWSKRGGRQGYLFFIADFIP
ncbi:MAG: hypothetical protein Q7T89_17150 [Anaerolineales bacterium]|nr:hypothetical protein [Anaerolineales bacterium]